MAVRPIDANAMLDELRPVSFEAEHSAVLLSDVSKMMREWVERQPTLIQPNEPRAGLYGKYTVYKNKDGSLVTDCFILRPAKDPAAVAALRAYAAATDNAELAADIINWVGAKPNEPLSIEQLREMDGEPVWVVYDQDAAKTTPGFDPLTLWALVEVTKTSVFLTNNFGGRTVYADDQDLEWAGITVYRRPPEGEEE